MIKTKEDGDKYVEEVTNLLKKLVTLSEEAGLTMHVAIWAFAGGLFYSPVTTLIKFRDVAIKFMEEEMSQSPPDSTPNPFEKMGDE